MFVQLSFYVSPVTEIVSLRQVLKATPGLSCPPQSTPGDCSKAVWDRFQKNFKIFPKQVLVFDKIGLFNVCSSRKYQLVSRVIHPQVK